MTHADQVIRKVSDLRDLCHRLKAAPSRSLTDEERAWHITDPTKKLDAETTAIPPSDSRQ
jgi:hypothetical protein